MDSLLARFRGGSDDSGCRCTPTFEADGLAVDAEDCPGGGRLATEPACRATVVTALRDGDVSDISTRAAGTERTYEGDGAAVLVAAGRFADAVAFHDDALASLACRDPLEAARTATGRAGPAADLAAETGLLDAVPDCRDYEALLNPYVGPVLSNARVCARPPSDATFVARRELDTGAVCRVYEQPARERRTYHLDPVEADLDERAMATLSAAYDRLANGAVSGGQRAPARAVRRVADADQDVSTLERVLRKHTHGYGILADLFADDRVSDVFATAPTGSNHLRVRVDGEMLRTNVRITADGVDALASRFRRESGRAFSRADPALDATATIGDRSVRVAGVTDPVSDGVAFAFRAHEREAWTLPALVANGTVPPAAGALLSLAVERDAAMLLAGARGAGKTTLLGSLLWELPAATRTVVIEDTPELPVEHLQDADRDVQRLRVDDDGGAAVGPTAALRTALRLGEGALVLGEVRGEEAAVLYEAMRVGASGSAVLGTIHGDGADDVRERVVTDLGVPPSSFGATDVLVTLESYRAPDGRSRRVSAIEELRHGQDGLTVGSLFELDDGDLVASGRIARGNSHLVETLARSTGSYGDVRTRLRERESWLADLAASGATDPASVCEAHARRRERD